MRIEAVADHGETEARKGGLKYEMRGAIRREERTVA